MVVYWQAVETDITVYWTSSLLTPVGKETTSPLEDIWDAFKELSLWDIAVSWFWHTGRRRRQGSWSLNNFVASQILVAGGSCNSFWCNMDSLENFTVLLNNINFLFPDWLLYYTQGRFYSSHLQYLLRGKYSNRKDFKAPLAKRKKMSGAA